MWKMALSAYPMIPWLEGIKKEIKSKKSKNGPFFAHFDQKCKKMDLTPKGAKMDHLFLLILTGKYEKWSLVSFPWFPELKECKNGLSRKSIKMDHFFAHFHYKRQKMVFSALSMIPWVERMKK